MILYVDAIQARITGRDDSTARLLVECYKPDVPLMLARLTPKEQQEVADALAAMGVVAEVQTKKET